MELYIAPVMRQLAGRDAQKTILAEPHGFA